MNEWVGTIDGVKKKIGIVVSRFNEPITKKLLEGALETLLARNVLREDILVVWVPGAFEIPFMAKQLAKQKCYDAVICLGAVIRGETPHFDYVAGEAASGIARTSLELDVPIIFGVLTTDTTTQALERIENGVYAAEAALEMISLTDQICFSNLQNV